MLDVIHVLYEEDIIPRWEQDGKIKSQARHAIYEVMYGREYQYGYSSEEGRGASFDPDEPPVVSRTQAVKPYMPPTPVEDLARVLDGPLR